VARTVPQAFNEFEAKIVPTETQRGDITGRRETVQNYLMESFGRTSNMPLLSTKVIGSAGRQTIIRPVDDVDVMALFDHSQVWSTYKTNSQAFLYRVRDALAKYQVKVVGARGQAVRLTYSAPPHADVTPVFKRQGGGYILPSGDGGWIATDPDFHADFMVKRNQELSSYLKPLIRVLKRWNREHSYRMKAFHLEMLTQAVFQSLTSSVPRTSLTFFQHAHRFLHVKDPAGHSGDLAAQITSSQEPLVIQSFITAAGHASKAIEFESAGRIQEALGQWRIIFGDEFPGYG
jgi:hypothetical protein